MKYCCRLIVLVLFSCSPIAGAQAQLRTGTEGLYIKAGTTLSSDGLVLNPSADLTLSGLIEKSVVPVTGSAGSGINRVYNFSTPITFSGIIGFYYLTGELNGNTESILQLAYKSSGAASSYIAATSTSVNTITKYLQNTFTATDFSSLTAADPAIFVIASNNADLSALALNPGTLSPTFAPGTNSYTGSVANNVSSLAITPTADEANATITVNGMAVTNGNASGTIPLNVGNNTLTIMATAQDGVTTNTYTVNVRRVAAQTITFNGLSPKTYGDTDFTLPETASSGLTVSYVSDNVSVATVSGNIVTIKSAGSAKITASQPGNSNYEAASTVEQNLLVSRKAITIIAAANNKTYGETDPVLTYTINSGALVGTDVFTGDLTREAGEAVGTYRISQGTVALNSNYDLSYIPANLTIDKRSLVVSADNKTKEYGSANPAFILSFSGFRTGENEANLTIAPSGNTIATTASAVGIYPIIINGGVSSNYTFSYIPGTLEITRTNLTVTADNKIRVQGNLNPPLTVSYSGFVNGDDNNVLSQQPVTATSALIASPAGNYPILVNEGVASNYNLTYVNGVFTVTSGSPTAMTLAEVGLYENQVAGTPAGTLSSSSEDPGATFTYSFISGSGDSDNSSFNISGNQIKTSRSLNYEQKAIYSVRVRTATQNGLTLDKQLSINLGDVNEIPAMASVADQIICHTPAQQSVALSGISAGDETDQTITLSVSSGNDNLFDALSVSQASGGNSEVRYRVKNGASGTAIITITAMDNGGTANGGINTISRSFAITVNPLPQITITSNKGAELAKGDIVQLTATGGNTYNWSNSGGIISGQQTAVLTARPSETTTYRVIVTTETGCVNEQEITVSIKEDLSIVKGINILTPNGDGVNDKFIIRNIDMYPTNVVKIFDRSGRLLYSKQNYKDEWEGTLNNSPLAEGTYYYIIDLGPGKTKLKGFISIVRD